MKLNRNIYSIFAFIFMLASSSLALAQNVTATLEKKSLKIGEQTFINLTIQYRVDEGKHVEINWQPLEDTLRKEIEVLSSSGIDTSLVNPNDNFFFQQSKKIEVTSFEVGEWTIPSFMFTTNINTDTLFSNDLLLTIVSPAVDTTLAIKDIKTIFSEEYTWEDWMKDNKYKLLIGLAGIIVLALLLYFGIRYFRKKPEPVVPVAPPIPAHIIAQQKLDALQEEQLWQTGKLKTYYSTLTDILREYIESRFHILAVEKTTNEIIYSFRHVTIEEKVKSELNQVLILADLVKFAKEHPLASENEQVWVMVSEFVKETTITTDE